MHPSLYLYFSVVFLLCMSMDLLISIMPLFLNIVMPLNESRLPVIMFKVEYFLDPVKYVYFIFVHLRICVVLAALNVVATGIMLYSYLLHACAVFKIIK